MRTKTELKPRLVKAGDIRIADQVPAPVSGRREVADFGLNVARWADDFRREREQAPDPRKAFRSLFGE